ncbi:MAG: hypothetical protein KIT14_23460 [bacterium]|nr:hypothetical protein [bacterium]
MGRPDEHVERSIRDFTSDLVAALGAQLGCLALHGSAAGEDWLEGRSDLNSVVVLDSVDGPALEAMAPVVGRWQRRRFAIPMVIDAGFLDRARDTFPMELDDIRRQHRVLAGSDLLADVTLDPEALRRQCEQEARGKLLRLRALFLSTGGAPTALERLMVESLKGVLIVLRHTLRLAGATPGQRYADALEAAAERLGPLPVLAMLLEHRQAGGRLVPPNLHASFHALLGEMERVIDALDALGA